MTALTALVLSLCPCADSSELQLATAAGPVRIVLDVRDGPTPTVAWAAFLDRLFDHFDRNGDGKLDRAEAARLIALPLHGRRTIRLDFTRADANGDGSVDKEELRAFFRAAGFTPLVGHSQPVHADATRLDTTLFRRLDRDGDGRLARAELGRAVELMGPLDENEDEVLTAAEVLAAGAVDAKLPAKTEASPPLTVRVTWPAKGMPSPDGKPARGIWSVVSSPSDRAADYRSTRQFLLAQFKAALGTEKTLARADTDADPGLQVFAELFDAADRDSNGKLTQAELERFLDLVGDGAMCQVSITLVERQRSLFDALDADGDGRLTLRELNTAPRLLGKLDALTADDLPSRYRLIVQRGTDATAFGPIPLARRPLAAQEVGTNPALKKAGPRWFHAADRNGDGVLSPREFPGPAELFRRLDRDGDGVLSLAEAEKK